MRIEIKEKRIFEKILLKRLGIKLDKNINGISIDSRKIQDGDMFIALKGDRHHGIDFIDKNSLDKLNLIVSDKLIDSPKVFKVKNSKIFLKNITTDFRQKINVKIIGITGTNGKTSTKELLVKFLKTKFKISYSEGNYNSTVSLPLCLLGCDSNSDYCILEMGASKNKEIEFLCNIAKPDIGVITNISESHLVGYDNFDQLISTKLDLYKAVVKNNGIYFSNKDDVNINVKEKSNSIVTYSYSDEKSDYFADISKIKDGMIYINNHLFNMPYRSEIFASNFLASFSIASYLGVDAQEIQKSLLTFTYPKGRGEILEKETNIIINDTYNANLQSMKSGIRDLKIIKKKKNITLILGDMLDLGDSSKLHHIKLGEFLNNLNFISNLFCIGEMMGYTAQIVKKHIKCKHFNNTDTFIEYFKKENKHNMIFYFKGSRGMGMENIIKEVFNK